MRGAAERFKADKARIASDPFYNHLITFVYERIFNIDVVQAEKIEAKIL